MGVLSEAGALAAIAACTAAWGCYTPALRDCTVSCASAGDCTGGQVCGDDGLCAMPEVAGQCARHGSGPGDPVPDAPTDAAIDARPMPMPDPPDPPRTVTLRIEIEGRGTVMVDGVGLCAAREGCRFDVPNGAKQRLRAFPGLGEIFDKWTSKACATQGASCEVTLTASTTVSVRFRR